MTTGRGIFGAPVRRAPPTVPDRPGLGARRYQRRSNEEILAILAGAKGQPQGKLKEFLARMGATPSNLYQWRKKFARALSL